ncbi:penicillin acylase family protein [Chryseomicrobium palamuruense]|uniref:Penicillin acylase family protein n=1 Tax=Chryseomicrobium palamuruense TaxID=682973 RepID=A0ABV8UWT3_9BACL
MKQGRKITLWVLGIIVTLALIAVLIVNWFIGSTKPVIEGELAMPSLEEEVLVTRDEEGVPHIDAKSDADLYRAQGFVQAQDRLFQMDLARRQASGRLAEVVGEAALSTDQFFLTFSLRDAAKKSYEGYSEEAKQVLAWYAEGVNDFIRFAKEDSQLSYEFTLLGYEPEEWTPVDSLTIGKYMAYDLGGNWSTLAIRHWALQNLAESKAQELFITYPDVSQAILEANKQTPVQVGANFPTDILPHPFNGSNNWVVAGSKTASGEPLLADDPHLGLSTPSIWYQMHLMSPEQNVSGVIFAGVPGIILGHNEEVAWGVTNVGPDVQDLYIEKPNPENPYEFSYDGEWEEAEVRHYEIGVKDQDSVSYEVVVTRHGPVISDVLYDESNPEAVFSMQWTALEPTQELQAILEMNKSSNWEEFESALEQFHAPAQNFVFAAKDGTIAYKANGRFPLRKQGDGQLPVPGDSSDYGWDGYVPYDELPRTVNPDEGFVATANNQVIEEEYPYHITDFWGQSYRYERIAEVLEAQDDLTVGDMMALQMDQHNLQARRFLPQMLDALEGSHLATDYAELWQSLRAWDQIDNKEMAQPLVFNKWIRKLPDVLFKDDIPEDIYAMMPGKANITDQLQQNYADGETSVWVEEFGGYEAWLEAAFKEMMGEMSEKHGADWQDWKWGEEHQLTFKHPLSAASPILAKLLNPTPVPIGGSAVTPQAAAFNDAGEVTHGASWRFVADLSDLTSAYHIVGPGQSGHLKSKWFHSQVQDWAEGNYHNTSITGNYEESFELILAPVN